MKMHTSDAATELNNTAKIPWDRFPRSEGTAFVVLFAVELLAIISGNAIVLAVFTRKRQLRRRKCIWLSINLALTDLLVGVIAGPVWVYICAERSDLLGATHSKPAFITSNFLLYFLPYASFVNLTIVSLERMYAILWPLKHRLLRARTYRMMIALCWILPTNLASMYLASEYNRISHEAFLHVWLVTSCLIFSLMVISYVTIWIKIRFYKHSQHQATTAQDRRLIKTSFMITASSMATWFAAILMATAVCSYPECKGFTRNVALRIFNAQILLLFASSLVNPIIYSFKVPLFRRAALRLVCGRFLERRVQPAIEMANLRRPSMIVM